MEDRELEFWSGDFQDRLIEPQLFALSPTQPEVIFAFLREPALNYFNRVWPAHVPGHIWNHGPELRPYIESAYIELLDFLLSDPPDGVQDIHFIDSMLVTVTCIGVASGLPLIKQLFDRELHIPE